MKAIYPNHCGLLGETNTVKTLRRDEVSDMGVDQVGSLVDDPMRTVGDPLDR